MATPDHYAATKAFGDIVPVRPDKHVAFEQRAIQQAIRDHVLQRELKGLYGVLDFGDSLYGESADQLWNNMETAFDHGLFTLGIRHGEKRYMDLARVAARHFADIDVRHCNPASFDFGVLVGPKIEPAEAERISRGLSVKSFEKVRKKGSSELTLPLDGSGQTYRFGGVWPGLLPDPTEHDQTGHVYGHSFNHTGHHRYDKPDQPGIGGSGIGGHTWVLGLLDLYRFYGDRRSLEVAELVGQATLRKLPKNGYRREAGWPAINLIALFNATGKIEYLRGAQELLQYLAQCEAEGRPGVKEHYTYTILQALRDYHMVTGDAGAKEMFLRRLDAATEADLAGANDAGIFDRIRTFDNERSWTSMADLAYGWRLTGDRKKYLDPIVPNLQIISMLMPDKSALWSAPWAMAALEEAGINADPNTSDGRPLKYSFLDLRFPRTKTAHLHDPQDKPIELLVLQHSGYRLARNNVKQKEVGSITITAPDGKTVLTQPLDHFGLHAYRLKLPSDGQRGTYTISIEDPQSTFGFATDAEGLVVPVGDSDKGLYLTWPHAYFRVPTSGVVKVKVTAFAVPAGGYRLYRPDGSLFAERIWPERQDKSEAAPQVAIPTTDPGRGGVWRLEMCHPKNYVHLESPQPYIATDPALLFGPNGK